MRVSFFVDGFNLYHSLRQAAADAGTVNGSGARWFDLRRLCETFVSSTVGGGAHVESIYYFSAYATHLQASDPQRIARHKAYIRCLEDQGVTAVMGKFKKAGSGARSRNEEKESDVALAVRLVAELLLDRCDMAVVVSGDTDLCPALRLSRELVPDRLLGAVFPYRRTNDELRVLVDRHMTVKRNMCFRLQLPDPYVLRDSTSIAKPIGW